MSKNRISKYHNIKIYKLILILDLILIAAIIVLFPPKNPYIISTMIFLLITFIYLATNLLINKRLISILSALTAFLLISLKVLGYLDSINTLITIGLVMAIYNFLR